MKFGNYIVEKNLKVAKSIIALINAQDKYALASWGIRKQELLANGVTLQVTGSKFKGHINIALKGNSYIIDAGYPDSSGGEWEWVSKKKVKNVKPKDLMKTLDNIIG
jgi:hypothetical protein